MWNTCGECSAHSEWLQYVSTEKLQEKTREGMFENPLGFTQELQSKNK